MYLFKCKLSCDRMRDDVLNWFSGSISDVRVPVNNLLLNWVNIKLGVLVKINSFSCFILLFY